MPTTIRVMSWNIERFGEGKGTDPGPPRAGTELINYICHVINQENIDIVGLMELSGGYGGEIANWITGRLNGGLAPPPPWQYKLSGRQDGGTQEEYIFLWRNQPGRLELDVNGDPWPTALVNVVDDNSLASFFSRFHWNAAQKAQLYQALEANKYIGHLPTVKGNRRRTKTWRIVAEKWDELNQMAHPEVTFAPAPAPQPPAMSQADQQNLADKLLQIDMLRFVTLRDRSPYLASFRAGNPAQKLMMALLHAPGPGDSNRFSAINVLALISPIRDAANNPNLLVMGDFNIAANQMADLAPVYDRFRYQGRFIFGQVIPVQNQQVFTPLTTPPVGLASLALQPDPRTSLIHTIAPDDAGPADVLANPYDKFYYRGGQPAANSTVINLAQRSAANQIGYDPNLGQTLLRFFRYLAPNQLDTARESWEEKLDENERDQHDKQRLSEAAKDDYDDFETTHGRPPDPTSAIAARMKRWKGEKNQLEGEYDLIETQIHLVDELSGLVGDLLVLAPTGMGSAATTYRIAVSDHLPITTELTFP